MTINDEVLEWLVDAGTVGVSSKAIELGVGSSRPRSVIYRLRNAGYKIATLKDLYSVDGRARRFRLLGRGRTPSVGVTYIR